MRWPRRRKPTAAEAFQARWDAWWESVGRRDVMRLLAEQGLPTDPYFNGPYWSEAEGIGDSARYGGVDVEDLGEMLTAFAEDINGRGVRPRAGRRRGAGDRPILPRARSGT